MFSLGILYHEWNNKVAEFIGYGGAGGVQAANG
jgi:hypothetical protein